MTTAKDVALIRKLEAQARQADAETRYSTLAADKLAHEKKLREATEYSNRIYTFDQDVNPKTVQDCIATIGVWRRQDGSAPIKIVFNSPGGSVFEGLALYDYIRDTIKDGTPVDTHGIGVVASMGGILLQAGEKRTVSPSAWFMIHEISSLKFLSIQKLSEQEDEIKFKKRLQKRCIEILADRSKMTADEITTKAYKNDWWMDASEAVAHGFADEIR